MSQAQQNSLICLPAIRMCGCRKHPHQPLWELTGKPKGGQRESVCFTRQKFQGGYLYKPEFPERWGSYQNEKPSVRCLVKYTILATALNNKFVHGCDLIKVPPTLPQAEEIVLGDIDQQNGLYLWH